MANVVDVSAAGWPRSRIEIQRGSPTRKVSGHEQTKTNERTKTLFGLLVCVIYILSGLCPSQGINTVSNPSAFSRDTRVNIVRRLRYFHKKKK